MSFEEARRQISILPYYHNIENEITKPSQGVWTSRYFYVKWRPSLGCEASSIVETLRFYADQAGKSFASQTTIARTAGLSLRAVQRWLSINESALGKRSQEWKEQWRFLHAYFLRSKAKRYRLTQAGPITRARRTTSIYHVAMDDPVHPDDEDKLIIAVSEVLAKEGVKDLHELGENRESFNNRPVGGQTFKRAGIQDDARLLGGQGAQPNGRNGSEVDRKMGINVKTSRKAKSAFKQDPRVQNLTHDEEARKDDFAREIGSWLHRKAGKNEMELHKSAGLHRRIAFYMPEEFVRQAMRDFEDRIAAAREGREAPIRNLSAMFYGFISRIAEQKGISLEPIVATSN